MTETPDRPALIGDELHEAMQANRRAASSPPPATPTEENEE